MNDLREDRSRSWEPGGWGLMCIGGTKKRRPFIPYASARWLSHYINPDRSQWPPIHEAYGFTTAHAMRRAKRKAGPEPG